MLHDLLTSLLGLEGDFVVKPIKASGSQSGEPDNYPSFELAPLALSRLSDSQVLSIKPLLHVAGLYSKISASVEAVLTSIPEPQPEPYHYTLADTIDSVVLEPYRDRICEIEGALLQHDGLLPVTYLVAQLRDQTVLLNFFSSLLDDARSVRGCVLLDLLWSRYHILPDSSPIRAPLGFCLDALGELFFSMLSKWIAFGQVPMVADVFFIAPTSKDYSVVETESAGSTAVEIHHHLIPKGIISPSLADKILLCGSAVRVLGLCNIVDDTSTNAENLSRLRQLNVFFDCTETGGFKMTAPGCVRYIEASVERARALLNGWLRGAVSPTLLEHLSAVKGLYLLGDGGFWQTFLEECAELTVARRGNVSEHDLSAGPWQLALAEHFTETSHQGNLASLRLLPLGFAYASKPLFNITKQSAGAVPTIDWELACKSSLCLVGTARLSGQGVAELLRLGSSGQCWATNRQLVARGRFSTEVEFIAPESSSTSSSTKEGSMSFVVLYQHIHSPSEIVVGSAGWSPQPNGKPCHQRRLPSFALLSGNFAMSEVRPAVPEFMYSAFPTSLGVEVRAAPTMLGSSKTTEFEVKLVLTSEGNRLPSVLAGGKSVSPGYRTTADDSFRTHTLSITNDTVKIDEVLVCKFRLPSSSPIMADSRSGWKLDGLGCCFLGICSTDSANGNSYLEICKWSHTQPGSESRSSSHGSSWLDRVVVVYELPWPLPLIIGTDEFTKYSVILRSLLSLRHSALGLDTLWQTLTRLSRRQREAKTLPWLTHILAVRARMAAWLSTVIQYFTIDVISVRYAEMVKKVSLSTTDFDGIVRAHRAFLADILSKCFLESNARSRKIRLSIEKLSRACTKLAALGKQGIFDDALPNERLGKAIKSLEDKFVVGVRDLISLLDDMHLTSSERAHSLSQLLLRLDYNEVYTSPPHTSINKPSNADTIRAESGGDGGSSGAGGRRVHEVAAPAVSEGTTVSAVHPDNVELQHERSNHIQRGSGVLSSEDYGSRRRPGTETSHLEGYDSAAGLGVPGVPGGAQESVSMDPREIQEEASKTLTTTHRGGPGLDSINHWPGIHQVLSAYEKSKALLESIRRRKLLRAAEEGGATE